MGPWGETLSSRSRNPERKRSRGLGPRGFSKTYEKRGFLKAPGRGRREKGRRRRLEVRVSAAPLPGRKEKLESGERERER